jgi:sugar lactone lactonase YvrE
MPGGEAREMAGELAFPNGMVVTPDNRTLVVADSFAHAAHRLRHRGRWHLVEPSGLSGRGRP